MKKSKIISSVIITILLGIMTFLAIKYWPFIKSLTNDEVRSEFVLRIKGSPLGFLAFLGLQILQVIVAVIPGEVIEVLAGVIYGPFLGLLVCELGLTISAIILYFLVKKLGEPFVRDNVSEKQFKRLSFLNDPRRSELVLFFVLLMPLTPKDAILYIVPLTKIRFKNFLIINAIARIPSILTSTIAGDVLLDGNYVVTIIIYVVNFVFALLCIIFNKQIIDFFDRIRNKNKTENDEIEKN